MEGSAFTELQQSALAEIANIGLGHASTSLSEMFASPFHMEIPRVVQTIASDAAADWGEMEEAVAVLVPFEGDADGMLSFLMPFACGQNLCAALVGTSPASSAEFSELEASVLLEFGNILNSSFLRAISDLTGLSLLATPPMVGIDQARSLLASVTAQAEFNQTAALTVETALVADDGLSLRGSFYCMPSRAGLSTIFDRLGLGAAA